MPNWKKLIVSGSDASLNSLNVTTNVTAQSFTGSFSGSINTAITASYALTASYVNTLNQTVIITGSLGVGVGSLGSTENTLVLGPAPAGGSGEGGQILLQAQGGSYTSASMLDNYQNKFRLLRGTNAGSDGYKLQVDLQTGQLQLPNYNSTSAFTGTTLVGLVGFDSSGNLLTTQTSSAALSGGSTNYVARWASSATLTTGSIYDSGSNVGIGTTTPESISSTTTLTINGSTGGGAVSFQVGGVRTGLVNGNDNYLTIQSYASRPLSLGYNGNNTIVVNTSNNVGIGTTSPSAKLYVNAGSNYPLILDSTQQYLLGLYSSGTAEWWLAVSGGDLKLHENGVGDQVTFKAGGNVGIGTTNPTEKLHLYDGTNPLSLKIQRTTVPVYFSDVQSATTTAGAVWSHNIKNTSNGSVSWSARDNVAYAASAIMLNADTGTSYITFHTTSSANLAPAERMRIAGDGNVGISTTSPSARLHISGSTDATQRIIVDGSGNNSSLHLNYNGSNVGFINSYQNSELNIGTAVSAFVNFYTNNTERMRIAAGGNVGIGTTAPESKLHVAGGQLTLKGGSTTDQQILFNFAREYVQGIYNSSGHFRLQDNSLGGTVYQWDGSTFAFPNGNVGIGTTSPDVKLSVAPSTDVSAKIGYAFIGKGTDAGLSGWAAFGNINAQAANQIALTQDGNGLTVLNAASGQNIRFRIANADKAIIDSSGNVGIGTTSPSTKLHVVGTSLFTDVLTFAGDTRYGVSKVYNSSTGDMFGMEQVSAAQTGTGAATRIFADDASNNYISLGSYTDATTFVDRLKVLTNNGNVGIGTSSPSQKLDVAGAISVSGSVVDYEVAPALIGGVTTTNIISFTPGTHYAAFVDYVIKDSAGATNQRVGTIQISISLAAAAAVMNEVTTIDIGNTSAITFAVSYGAPTWLTATNSGATPYDINYMVRYF